MKYRIVKNGLGEYAVQIQTTGGWKFWNVAGPKTFYQARFKSETAARIAIEDKILKRARADNQRKKADTWEVVG